MILPLSLGGLRGAIVKNILIVLLVVGVVYWLTQSESDIDKLMKVDESALSVSKNGVVDVHPEPGSEVNADELVEYGVPTVVYVYMASCDSCKRLDAAVNRLVSYRPDVSVKKVHMKYGYGLRLFSQGEDLASNFAPFIIIYDKTGKRMATDRGDSQEHKFDGYRMLFDWMNAEGERAFERERG